MLLGFGGNSFFCGKIEDIFKIWDKYCVWVTLEKCFEKIVVLYILYILLSFFFVYSGSVNFIVDIFLLGEIDYKILFFVIFYFLL